MATWRLRLPVWVPWLKPCDDLFFFHHPKSGKEVPTWKLLRTNHLPFLGLGLCEKVTRSKSMAKSKGSSNSWDKKGHELNHLESNVHQIHQTIFWKCQDKSQRPNQCAFLCGGELGGGGWELVENSMGNSTPSWFLSVNFCRVTKLNEHEPMDKRHDVGCITWGYDLEGCSCRPGTVTTVSTTLAVGLRQKQWMWHEMTWVMIVSRYIGESIGWFSLIWVICFIRISSLCLFTPLKV